MKSLDLNEMVIKYLKDNGFDGLCSDECGCTLDDLFPCETPSADCCGGYSHPEKAKENGLDFWMETGKP